MSRLPQKIRDFRRPTQERGRKKFESILDAAHQLLLEREPTEISVYDLADALDTSPPSIYHFFSDTSQIFTALAERYLAGFESIALSMTVPAVDTWLQVADAQFDLILEQYRSNPPMRKIILGTAYYPDVRQRDFAASPIYARILFDTCQKFFMMPDIPEIVERFVHAIAISDAIWALSVFRHGNIMDADAHSARLARNAYLRLFIPEFLPARPQAA